jgi:hypothetical protein
MRALHRHRVPTDFMIRYHLYRLHFPLMALGRLRERLNA